MGSKTKQVKRTRQKAARKQESPFAEDGRVYRTLSTGVTVECLGIADEIQAQESNVRAQVEWPEVPTYSFSDDGVRAPHTEETIADPRTSDEERQAWAEYKAAQARAEAEFAARLGEGRLRLLATRGTRIVDYAELEPRWAEEHEWLGMAVPDDPRERLLHFFRFEVVGKGLQAQEDARQIATGIYQASGADEEVLARAEAAFRAGKVGRSRARADAGAGAAAAEAD